MFARSGAASSDPTHDFGSYWQTPTLGLYIQGTDDCLALTPYLALFIN